MCKFSCFKCGYNQIKFEIFVKHQEDVVVHPDGHIQYCNPVVYDSNVVGAVNKYICGTCNNPILLYGDYITNESKFKEYLAQTKKQRRQMEAEYDWQLKQNAQLDEKKSDEQGTLFTDPEN